VWYTYTETSWILQTTEFANINFDVTDKLNVEAGVVHFHDDEAYNTPVLGFAYAPNSPSYFTSDSHKWNSKLGVNYKITDHAMLYADWAQGFRPGGSNSGDPPGCYTSGVPSSTRPTRSTISRSAGRRPASTTAAVERCRLRHGLEGSAGAHLQRAGVSVLELQHQRGRRAHLRHGVEHRLQVNDNWSLQASANYTDSRVISTVTPDYQSYVGERLPFAPYFSWSWNARYEQPLSNNMRGYVQFDMAHKGDMWNGLNPNDVNTGLPRLLQPSYTIMNLRFGLNPANEQWLAEFYITNLTDKNAIVYSNTGNFDLRETTNEPRVFGLRLNYRWGKGT